MAAGWSPPDAPESWRLTAALFEAIAAHDGLLSRLAGLPPDRLPALLASAAVSFLVRRDKPAPLAGYFPEPGAPHPPFDAGFYPAAKKSVWARHFEGLQQLLADGTLILAGPTLGTINTGLAIFEAPDEQAARKLMEQYPARPQHPPGDRLESESSLLRTQW